VYLTPEEHRPALRGEIPDLRERVTRRRGEESWALRNRGPVSYGPEEGEMPDPGAFPSGLRRVFTVMGWMMKGEEPLPEDPSGPLRGLGLGDRVVTGKARVVERPEELARVRHGEIVVCRITSPEWSVGLGRVAALVTEEGGALSHPAIIARELGVPAVLGATGAMRRISTGDRVRVDPITGVIEVLARE
jgi:phosphohistidine swiveling domain-containing protein